MAVTTTCFGEQVNVTEAIMQTDFNQKDQMFYKITGRYFEKVFKSSVIFYSFNRQETLNKYIELLNLILNEQEVKINERIGS